MNYTKILVLSIILLLGCKKKDKPENVPESDFQLSNGYLILNEGLMQLNNSSLSWVDLSDGTVNNEIFTQTTGRLLGDTGNEMKRYGGKIYVLVTASSTVEILSAKNLKSLKQIEMKSASGNSKQPRSITFYGTNAYITCYDGFVDVLDTSSMQITQRIQVGSNPEDLCVAGNRLFVTNSGGLNAPNMDSTISVIDLATHTEIQKITIGKNPGTIVTAPNGMIYAISRGDYMNIPSRMHRIDPANLLVAENYTFDASGIDQYKDNKLLINYFNYSNNQANVAVFDLNSNSITNSNLIDMSQITLFYGINYNEQTAQFFCFDAMNYSNTGYLRIFNENGSLIKSYHLALNPNSILFF